MHAVDFNHLESEFLVAARLGVGSAWHELRNLTRLFPAFPLALKTRLVLQRLLFVQSKKLRV